MKINIFWAFFMCCFVSSSWANSGAYNNDASDARSLGNSGAVVARPLSSATNWYNPAGLTELSENEYALSFMFESFEPKITSTQGNTYKNQNDLFFIPSFFMAQNKSSWAWGIGLNAAYGLATEWEAPEWKYVATSSEFTPLCLNGNVAWKISDKTSIAGGLNLVYAKGELKRDVNQTLINAVLTASNGAMTFIPYADGKGTLEGDDIAFGFNLALLHKFNDKLQFGASYRSYVDLNLEGDFEMTNLSGATAAVFGANYSTDASLKLPLPATFTFGLAYFPSDKLSVEVELELAEWSIVDELKTKFLDESNPVRLSLLNSGNPIRKDWDDTWNVSLGIEYELNETWTVRCGTRFRPTPVPEDTVDPTVPSVDVYDAEGGFTYTKNDYSISFVIAYAWGEDDVNNQVGNDLMNSVDGTYDVSALVIGCTYKKNF